MLGCLLFNSTEKMTFLEADRYCKEAYNSSALAEALTEEVGFEIILSLYLTLFFSNLITSGRWRKFWKPR